MLAEIACLASHSIFSRTIGCLGAFAIHDRTRRRVVLSRDRFGIKPLFIADGGSLLAFASELTALRMVRGRPELAPLFRPSQSAAHAVLAWGYVPELDTIHQGVQRLPPGTRLTVDLVTGERHTRRYYTLRPSPEA